MAISVDTVYQRVLALANKEQRGYITPQEFNLLANQAQMQIFESYFYTKNLRDRQEPVRSNEVDETDLSELLDAKLVPFQSIEVVTDGHTFPSTVGVDGIQYDVFQTGNVYFAGEVARKISINEAQRFIRSPRHFGVSGQNPIYSNNIVTARDILLYAGSSVARDTGVTVEVFRVPRPVNWTYVVVNGKALYNGSDTSGQDFELHRSEEDTLVNAILSLSGIMINKTDLTQFAAGVNGLEAQTQNQ